jgi:glycosyltransferase involved in cell wall biosynthesis
MVGPIPVRGSYMGGIGVSLRRLIDHWNLPVPMVHFNTELFTRPYGSTGQLRLRNFLLSVVTFLRLSYSIAKVRPRLVHYHTSRGLAFLKDMMLAGIVRCLFRVTTVLHIRSSDATLILASRAPRLQRFQLRVLHHCCDRLVLLSENVLNDFAAILGPEAGRRFRSRCTVLPNFTLLPATCRKHQEPADYVRVFYIGNLGAGKGIYDILEAARRLKGQGTGPFQVILAGPFNDRQEELRVRMLVAEHHLAETITFLGTIYERQKEAAFLQADIFVLPSYSEGMPQSLLEAMAYGLPVVVSNVGGIPELVREGQEGLLIRPGDIDELCRALKQLMESVECRQRMGAAARQRMAAHHTVEIYLRQLQELYDSVLTAPAASRSSKNPAPALAPKGRCAPGLHVGDGD